MGKNEFLNCVYKKLNETDLSFTANKGVWVYGFTQMRVGNAKFIYSEFLGCSYKEKYDFDIKLELVGVFVDKYFYIARKFLFHVDSNSELPVNIYLLESKFLAFNEDLISTIFTKFYESLPVNEITDEDDLSECVRLARRVVVYKDMSVFDVSGIPILTKQDYYNHLCGKIDLKKVFLDKCVSDTEYFICEKSKHEKIKELAADPNTFKPHERKIIDALDGANAKTVLVDFELNGKVCGSKMETKSLFRVISGNYEISSYDFCSSRAGKDLFKKLDVTYGVSLETEDISRISYNGKNIYERN